MTPLADARTVTDRLTALAEPSRLRIIEALAESERSVSELATHVKLELVNVSHHLGVLKNVGLVNDRKKGRYIFYSLNPEHYDSETRTFKFGPCEVTFKKKDPTDGQPPRKGG